LLADASHDITNDKVDQHQAAALDNKHKKLKQTSNDVAQEVSDVAGSMLDKIGATLADTNRGTSDKVVHAKSNVVEKWEDFAQAAIDKAADAKVGVLEKSSLNVAQGTKNKVVDAKADATKKWDQTKPTSSDVVNIVVGKVVDANDNDSKIYEEIKQTSLEDVQATIDMFNEASASTTEKVGDQEKTAWEKVVQAKRTTDEMTDQAMHSLADKFGEVNANVEQKVEAIAKQAATTIRDATKEASLNVGRAASEKVGQAKGSAVAFARRISDDVTEGIRSLKDSIAPP
jgi:hypothetical protein